ncbi:MAG: NADH-ubiquinone oxidoreductase-F iron-sulfur binding region domain-containing protein [Mycobacteriales bacterium]
MRLLTDSGPTHAEHETAHGPLTLPRPGQLLDAIEAAGLLGRGGAGFPTARKMRTVAAGKHPVVLGNACEGEPASRKDAVLLTRHPHLVLDGLDVAAAAVGARDRHLAVHAGSPALPVLRAALRERRTPVRLHEVPPTYTASEESALVSFINTGTTKPLFTPPRPFEQGIGRRPTLVNNAETLAHLALIARHGPAWFREVGDAEEPGTLLLTVDGTVVEVPTGSLLHDVVALPGAQAVLVGGYFGTWLSAAQARDLTLTHRDLRAAGGALGAGIVLTLPAGSCGLVETARVAAYLANESAGQCGPCLNGLPAIARAVRALAVGPWDDTTMTALDRWLGVVPGRGACRHPDGAVRFVLSALSVFADDVAAHRAGHPCAGARAAPVLPLPRRTAA